MSMFAGSPLCGEFSPTRALMDGMNYESESTSNMLLLAAGESDEDVELWTQAYILRIVASSVCSRRADL